MVVLLIWKQSERFRDAYNKAPLLAFVSQKMCRQTSDVFFISGAEESKFSGNVRKRRTVGVWMAVRLGRRPDVAHKPSPCFRGWVWFPPSESVMGPHGGF